MLRALLLLSAAAALPELSLHVPLPCAAGNCTAALGAALQTCARSASPCRVTLDAGTYALTGSAFPAAPGRPTVPRLSLLGASAPFSLAGAGSGATTLLLDDIATAVYVAGAAASASFSGFAIASARAPYTLGVVVAASPAASVLAVDGGAYALDPGTLGRLPWLLQAQAALSFDPVNRRVPPGATDIYATANALPLGIVAAGAGGYFNVSLPAELRLGDTIILRHVVYGATGIEAHHSGGLAVTDVALSGVAGMGVYASAVGDVTLDGVRLTRDGGAPMSINADGLHICNPRGGAVVVRNCVLEGQGDDGLNVNTLYLSIEALPDAHTLRLGKWGAFFPAGLLPLQAGDTLAFVSRASMREVGTAAVAAVSQRNGSVTLAGAGLPPGAALYDLVYSLNGTAASVEVRNNTFTQNRARGALLKAHNLLAVNNIFNFSSGPAAQAIPDGCSWYEGITLRNWSFVNNTVYEGDYGGDAQAAQLFVGASTPAYNGSVPSDKHCSAPLAAPVHAGLRVEGNTFHLRSGKAAFAVSAAAGVSVVGNTVLAAAGQALAPFDFVGQALQGAVAGGNSCPARPGGVCAVSGFNATPSLAPPAPPAFVYLPLPDPSAQCLDGSRYGVFLCKAATNTSWEFAVQGGGWAYDLQSAAERSLTPLGSSLTWAAQAQHMRCLNDGVNYVYMQYCDGGSFGGYREESVPTGYRNISVVFRGARSLQGTLALAAELGLRGARNVTFTGSSAGGATVFHHLDAVAAYLAGVAPGARVLGKPTCGFFIASNATLNAQLGSVYAMQNSSATLSRACQRAQAPGQGWRCFIPSVLAPYVATPWFALQSRFDLWQLGSGELYLPCMRSQPFAPPFHPSTCTPAEDAAISAYGATFMGYLQPLIDAPGGRNGGFVDACIIHGSTNSSIDGSGSEAAFLEWAAGGRAWWVARCGNSTSAGPCDPSPVCVPFP